MKNERGESIFDGTKINQRILRFLTRRFGGFDLYPILSPMAEPHFVANWKIAQLLLYFPAYLPSCFGLIKVKVALSARESFQMAIQCKRLALDLIGCSSRANGFPGALCARVANKGCAFLVIGMPMGENIDPIKV